MPHRSTGTLSARARDKVAESGGDAPRLNSNAARGKFAPSRTITKSVLDKLLQGFCANLLGGEWVLLGQWLSLRSSNFPGGRESAPFSTWRSVPRRHFTRYPRPRRRPFGKTFSATKPIRQAVLYFIPCYFSCGYSWALFMGGQIAPAAALPSFIYGYFSPSTLNWCYPRLSGRTANVQPARIKSAA